MLSALLWSSINKIEVIGLACVEDERKKVLVERVTVLFTLHVSLNLLCIDLKSMAIEESQDNLNLASTAIYTKRK